MRVEIIDDTHQRFNGKTYFRNKRGWFQSTYSTIHRDVWKYHNGDIPKGYDIHHIDGDKANNQIENLQCLTRKEHRKLHGKPATVERQFTCVDCGTEFTSKAVKALRCPDCRKKRERERARAADARKRAERPPKPPKLPRVRQCVVCGKTFELKLRESLSHGRKTCSDECLIQLCGYAKTVDRRRICEVCGKPFERFHKQQKTCSPECGKKLAGCTQTGRQVVARVISHCELCGKPIEHLPSIKPRFCSQDCVHRFIAQINTKTEHVSPKEIRTCIVCGKPFEVTKSAAKQHCSTECYRHLHLKPCAVCGKMFYPRRPDHKCCSRECGDKHKQLTWLDKRKARD